MVRSPHTEPKSDGTIDLCRIILLAWKPIQPSESSETVLLSAMHTLKPYKKDRNTYVGTAINCYQD